MKKYFFLQKQTLLAIIILCIVQPPITASHESARYRRSLRECVINERRARSAPASLIRNFCPLPATPSSVMASRDVCGEGSRDHFDIFRSSESSSDNDSKSERSYEGFPITNVQART